MINTTYQTDRDTTVRYNISTQRLIVDSRFHLLYIIDTALGNIIPRLANNSQTFVLQSQIVDGIGQFNLP